MFKIQKIIKYLVIVFALLFIVNIILVVFIGSNSLSSILNLKSSKKNIKDLEEISLNLTDKNLDYLKLKIELDYTSLEVKNGKSFRIETNNSNIITKKYDNQLLIKEKSYSFFTFDNAKKLIIYVPKDFSFQDLEIDMGSGDINIERLSTGELSFEIGAGKVKINNLNVFKNAEISSETGNVSILSGEINNLDLDLGVGKFILKSVLNGRSDIDSGIGTLEIDLIDDIENYCIKTNKGIGEVFIDDKKIIDGDEYCLGNKNIEIEGETGTIKIY